MKMFTQIIKYTLCLLLLAFAVAMPIHSYAQEVGVEEEMFTLNFKNADIKDLVKFVSDATGMVVIIDPKVKAKFDLISKDPVNKKEMYDLFLAVLQVNKYAAIKNGNVLRIIPDKNARSAATPVLRDMPKYNNADFVTQIIKLDNANAARLIPVLRSLVPPQAYMAAYADANAIVVADTIDNVRRIFKIIRGLDKTTASEIEVFKLQHSSADEFVSVAQKVLKKTGKTPNAAGQDLTLVADKRSNSVIVTGSNQERRKVKQLLEKLDGPLTSSGNAQVVKLKFGKAKELAPVLSKVSQSLMKVNNNGSKAANQSAVSIEADEASNALIITASGDVMESIMQVVEQLDVPRRQVLVEAIIVEIVGDDGKKLGFDWMVGDSNKGFGASNNSQSLANLRGGFVEDKDKALTGLAAALATATGGVLGGATYDVNGTSFAAVLTALESNQEANILSTPSLMTLDNNEAQIVVGQEVPFVTGSYTATGNGGSSNPGSPFQTIKRENVGLTLKVTPHINEGGRLTLDILQEVSNVVGSSTDASNGLVVTNERKIETSVATGDGETIVLGGLIRDEVQETVRKVPLLGDIPLLGRLFKSSSTNVRKTNLMVFLRPTVINDAETALSISEEKYDFIRKSQLYKRDIGVDLFKDDVVPVLPTWEEHLEQHNGSGSTSANDSDVDDSNSLDGEIKSDVDDLKKQAAELEAENG